VPQHSIRSNPDETLSEHESEPPNAPTPPPSTIEADRNQLRNAIQGGFQDIRPDLLECYELLRDLEPNAADRLVFELTVTADPDDPERGVTELNAIRSGSFVVEDLACFAEAVGDIEMPPPNDEPSYQVNYPVVLSAE
jgi:hypothetical protein